MNNNEHNLLPWKFYLTITLESVLAFYLSSFCIAMFITHRGTNWLFPAILLGILYVFVIFATGKRIIQKLPLPVLMLVIPLAPLFAIIAVISLIPILEKF